MKKITTEEYKNQIKDLGVICLDEYTLSSVNTKHQCKKCKHIWYPPPNSIKSGKGCPECKKITTEEYKEQIKDLGVICLDEYTLGSVNTKHQCKKCNHIWYPPPDKIKSGSGCPECKKTKQSILKSFTTEEYKNQIKDLGVICLGEYTLGSVHTKHQCNKCKHIWYPPPNRIKSGRGCPECNKITTEKYKNQIKDLGVICLDEYTLGSVKTKHQCKKCKHIWYPPPNRIKSGRGCPRCSARKTAYDIYKNKETIIYYIRFENGVYKIGLTMTSVKIRYSQETMKYKIIAQKTFKDGMEAWTLEDRVKHSRLFESEKYQGEKFLLNTANTECFKSNILAGYLT